MSAKQLSATSHMTQHIVQEIDALRERRGISKVEFSELTNINRSYWNKVLNGLNAPTLDVIARACKVLGCNLELVPEQKSARRRKSA